jgi:hypothetical protein
MMDAADPMSTLDRSRADQIGQDRPCNSPQNVQLSGPTSLAERTNRGTANRRSEKGLVSRDRSGDLPATGPSRWGRSVPCFVVLPDIQVGTRGATSGVGSAGPDLPGQSTDLMYFCTPERIHQDQGGHASHVSRETRQERTLLTSTPSIIPTRPKTVPTSGRFSVPSHSVRIHSNQPTNSARAGLRRAPSAGMPKSCLRSQCGGTGSNRPA